MNSAEKSALLDEVNAPEGTKIVEEPSDGSVDGTITRMEPPLPVGGQLAETLETKESKSSHGENEVVWGGLYALRIKRADGHWLAIGWNGVPKHRTDEQIEQEQADAKQRKEKAKADAKV